MKKQPKVYFRLTNTDDPEIRVENAILWKHFSDLYGDDIAPLQPNEYSPNPDIPIFGTKEPHSTKLIKTTSKFKYWEDPAFLKYCKRDFGVFNFQDACKEVDKLHAEGKDAFVKSTASKKLVMGVYKGSGLLEQLGPLAYDYCDVEFPCLMVQEFVPFVTEMRYFIIDRKIASYSKASPKATPLKQKPAMQSDFERETHSLAGRISYEMSYRDAVVDISYREWAYKKPYGAAVVEYNPMIPGLFGLYNCNAGRLTSYIKDSRLEERLHLYR